MKTSPQRSILTISKGRLFGRAVFPVAVPVVGQVQWVAAVLENHRHQEGIAAGNKVASSPVVEMPPRSIQDEAGVARRMTNRDLGLAAIAPDPSKSDGCVVSSAAQRTLDETEGWVVVYVFGPDTPIF
jgi:hypothetical protein